MNTCHIYLSGSIKKGADDMRDSFWTKTDLEAIRVRMQPVPVQFLNPSIRADDVADASSVFGHDLFQVYCSDFVLVDGRDRRGIGIGVEMAFATFQGIPIIALGQKNSHYFRDSLVYLGQKVEPFVHPFIHGLSTYIGYSLNDVSTFMRDSMLAGTQSLSNTHRCMEAIKHYVTTNLSRDHFMYDIVANSDRLRARLLGVIDEQQIKEILLNGRSSDAGTSET